MHPHPMQPLVQIMQAAIQTHKLEEMTKDQLLQTAYRLKAEVQQLHKERQDHDCNNRFQCLALASEGLVGHGELRVDPDDVVAAARQYAQFLEKG